MEVTQFQQFVVDNWEKTPHSDGKFSKELEERMLHFAKLPESTIVHGGTKSIRRMYMDIFGIHFI